MCALMHAKSNEIIITLHGIEPDLFWASIMSTTHSSPSLTSPLIITFSGHNQIFGLGSTHGIYTVTISNIQHNISVPLDRGTYLLW